MVAGYLLARVARACRLDMVLVTMCVTGCVISRVNIVDPAHTTLGAALRAVKSAPGAPSSICFGFKSVQYSNADGTVHSDHDNRELTDADARLDERWTHLNFAVPQGPAGTSRQCFVKTLTGGTITLTVPYGKTVDDIKFMIQDKEGVPPDQQRLIYGGQQMTPGSDATDYIPADGSIHLVLRLRGGMYHESSARDGGNGAAGSVKAPAAPRYAVLLPDADSHSVEEIRAHYADAIAAASHVVGDEPSTRW